jgi:hypothetical protein
VETTKYKKKNANAIQCKKKKKKNTPHGSRWLYMNVNWDKAASKHPSGHTFLEVGVHGVGGICRMMTVNRFSGRKSAITDTFNTHALVNFTRSQLMVSFVSHTPVGV